MAARGHSRWASAPTGETWGWFRAAYGKTAPRETEAEGTDAQATRVRPTDPNPEPLPVPPGDRAPGNLGLGGDFRSRGRPSPPFRQACETARFSRGPRRPRSLTH